MFTRHTFRQMHLLIGLSTQWTMYEIKFASEYLYVTISLVAPYRPPARLNK